MALKQHEQYDFESIIAYRNVAHKWTLAQAISQCF